MSSNIHIWAAISILVMVIVIAFMDWVPTTLNRNILGISVRERLPSTIIHSSLGLVFAMANVFGLRWLILAGAIWFSVVLIAAIRNWWTAYFLGVYWGEITPGIYAQHYAHNLRVLPPFGKNPVTPDVQHTLIHLSVLVASLLSWYSFWLA